MSEIKRNSTLIESLEPLINKRVASQQGLKFTAFKEDTDPEAEIYELYAVRFSFLKVILLFPILLVLSGVIILPICLYWSQKLRSLVFFSKANGLGPETKKISVRTFSKLLMLTL